MCDKSQVYAPKVEGTPSSEITTVQTPTEVKAVKKEKAAIVAPSSAEEGDDEVVPDLPKAKNPLDLLPKSSFNLDEWKRFYSNNETRFVFRYILFF